jgi:hypothetical protein
MVPCSNLGCDIRYLGKVSARFSLILRCKYGNIIQIYGRLLTNPSPLASTAGIGSLPPTSWPALRVICNVGKLESYTLGSYLHCSLSFYSVQFLLLVTKFLKMHSSIKMNI